MKKIATLLVLSLLLLEAVGQESAAPQNPEAAGKKILLIPYNPMMHLSDADHDISEYSGKNPREVRTTLRYGLAKHISAKLVETFPTYSIMSNVLNENEGDLDVIYGAMNYKEDKVFPAAKPVKDTLQKKSLFSKKRSAVETPKQEKYMNVQLSHPALLEMLKEKYNTDLFLFLNEFDIVTNYNACLDLAMKIYRRQLKVHYSVFDVSGRQLYGDVAVVDFPSNSNDVQEIMAKNFPQLADYIVKSIPGQNNSLPN